MPSEREWCWPFFHDWAKWSGMQRGHKIVVLNAETPSLRSEEKLYFTFQQRECKRCGQIQTRKL